MGSAVGGVGRCTAGFPGSLSTPRAGAQAPPDGGVVLLGVVEERAARRELVRAMTRKPERAPPAVSAARA